MAERKPTRINTSTSPTQIQTPFGPPGLSLDNIVSQFKVEMQKSVQHIAAFRTREPKGTEKEGESVLKQN